MTLVLGAGALRLAVKDDGVDAVPPAERPAGSSPGLGLSSMRERAMLSGGELSIQASPDQATTIAASWPLATGASGR